MSSVLNDRLESAFLLGTRFEQQVSLYPDAVALTLDGASLAYADLNIRANQLAACLRKHGIGAESLVGVYLDRSFELVVAILAILKAGGAYLPLDLACPAERLAFMLDDSGAKVLITDSRLATRVGHNAGKTILLDETDLACFSAANVETSLCPDSLAYVIYTSGSTGTPKGVLVTHENVARLFTSTEAWFQFGPRDVWTFFHSCAFDFSVWEIFGALLYGGRLVIVPYDVSRSADAFHDLIVREKVTVLNQTPSAFRQLVAADRKRPKAEWALRYVIFGGEALEFQSLAPWFARYGAERPRCINMYGITETTVHVTYHPITEKEVVSGCGSNIGIPLPDLQVYVVDAEGKQVAPGEVGEMLVGGKGVARGYLNRPDLTRERFVPNTFAPELGPRLYRSGDSARCLPNGDLEYLGRIDQQVKIRGFRIELSEIESVLARYNGIRECAVVARAEPGGEPRLVAYIVADPNTVPTIDELRAHLSAKLPEYMVPAVCVFLDSFPLTLNGKLDRDKLPAPDTQRPRLAAEYIAPQGELEEGMAKIWRNILRLDAIGTRDNFFFLGGDSLSAMKMLAQVEKFTGCTVGTRPLLEGATIENIAAAIRAAGPASAPSMMIRTQAGNGEHPFFFAHGDYFFGGLYCQTLAQHLGSNQPFYAIAPHGTFGGPIPATVEEMAATCVALIRSVQPKGPYFLGGFCNGAVMMYEAAQQLIRAGDTVAMLVLLDPPDLDFFILRKKIMEVGKIIGMSEHQRGRLYERIVEAVEIWKDDGPLRLLKEIWNRSIRWTSKSITRPPEFQPAAHQTNLDFTYDEVLTRYEPADYKGSSAVWIILRHGESHRHPRQIGYWNQYVVNPRFEAVIGTHMEFKSSLDDISRIIIKAMHEVAVVTQ
jgi:amino acid adenylation domain-containing protein